MHQSIRTVMVMALEQLVNALIKIIKLMSPNESFYNTIVKAHLFSILFHKSPFIHIEFKQLLHSVYVSLTYNYKTPCTHIHI